MTLSLHHPRSPATRSRSFRGELAYLVGASAAPAWLVGGVEVLGHDDVVILIPRLPISFRLFRYLLL